MSFDKWFYKQEKIVQLILLLIPVVNWIVECLIRLSVYLRTKSTVHLVVLILFVVVGWGWVLGVIDLVYLMLCGRLILAE